MSDCEYFARGSCLKDNCTYRHVKHNADTKACEDFNNGFCATGKRCKLRHVLYQQSDLTGKTKHVRKRDADRTVMPKHGEACATIGVETDIMGCHISSASSHIDSLASLSNDHVSKMTRATLEETDLFIPLLENEDFSDCDMDIESDLGSQGTLDSDSDEDDDQWKKNESYEDRKAVGTFRDITESTNVGNARPRSPPDDSIELDKTSMAAFIDRASSVAEDTSSQGGQAHNNRRVLEELQRAGVMHFFPSAFLSDAMSWA